MEKNIKHRIYIGSIKELVKSHIVEIAKEKDVAEDTKILNDITRLIENVRRNPNHDDANFMWEVFCDINPLMVNADEQSIINLLREELGVNTNQYVIEIVRERKQPKLLYTSNGIKISRYYPRTSKLITIN